jgi:L-iditol 2-dehydrogenase
LLKVLACAVCGTDVKMLEQGHRDLRYPRILGHEVTAEILEMDAPSDTLGIGDRVQVWPGEACGSCPQCLSGKDHLCPSIGIMGFNQDGGMAQMMSVKDVSRLVPIGRADPLLLTMAEPLACCINAQDKLAVGRDDMVLIIGGGPMGCINAQLARQRGAGMVLVSEKEEERLRTVPAGLFDEVSSPDRDNLREMVRKATSGKGADVVIPCTPNVRLDKGLFEVLAPGGRICIFSGPRKDDSPLPIDVREMHYREQMVVGSYGNSSEHNRKAVQMLSQGRMDLSWLITGRFSLDDAKDAFGHASARKGQKAIITI